MKNKFYEQDKIKASKYLNRAFDYERLFMKRPFGERNQSLYRLAQILKFVLPVISILTGVHFMINVFTKVCTPIIACAIAILIIGLLEYIKSVLLTLTFMNKFRNEPTFLLWIIVLMVSISSIFLSTRGGFEWFVVQSNQKMNQEKVQLYNEVHFDSVQLIKAQDYQFKIDQLNQHRKQRWGGMLTTEENKQILFYQQKLAQLEEEKKLHSKNAQAYIMHKKENLLLPIIVILLCCAINDILIFWSNWFVVHFKYKVVEEVNTLTSQTFSSSSDFYALFDEIIHVQTSKNQEKQLIEQEKQSVQTTNESCIAQNAQQEQKIMALKKAIESGCRDMRRLCSLGFNPKQVKEALSKPKF